MLLYSNLLAIIIIILPASGYRILGIFPHNGKSHFMMNEQLLKGLAKRGHRVDVISHFPLKKSIRNYNQILDLTGTIPFIQNNMSYTVATSWSLRALLSSAVTAYGDTLCDLMDQPKFQEIIKNPPKDPPYDLVIVNILGATCYLALGQHFGVPVVGTIASVLWPWVNGMVANPDDPAYIPGVFSGLSGHMNFWQRMQNTLQLAFEKSMFDYYSLSQEEKIKKYIGPNAPSLREAEKNVSLILTNTHFTLNGVRPYTTAVVEVGGLHIPEKVDPLPEDLQKWLDESEDGCVYMSFGSMITMESFPEETLKSLYTSMAKLAPVRFLIKVAKPDELPEGLPENVLTRPWIPQLAVLRHGGVRAFVTHGGLMGTQEAAYCGVPMIGIPFFTDQPQNMQVFLRKNAAIILDHEKDLTVDKLDAAFDSVLNDPSYFTAAKEISKEFRDRLMSPLETAIFWIEHVAKYGGRDLRSSAVDLTWWQIALIDVYGFLLFIVVSAMYLAWFLISKFVKRVFKSRDKITSAKSKDKKLK